MADRIARATGNLTAAATWGLGDSTAKLDSETGNTALTTAYVESQSFTPGAITIDAILVKIASRAAIPSGTFSVRLAQAAATVAGTEVTVNVSDVQSANGGWMLFRFAAPVTLVAATLYTVSAKTSVVSMVNLYRNATGGNWARQLRTTTTGAPAAGDDMFICGEWASAATVTARTVTMDSTAATDYGSTSITLAGFVIGDNATLTWGTTAATNYILRLSAILQVQSGGTLNMGTVATPCPRDSSQQLEFDCAVDGDFGLKVYGTWVGQGLSRTVGKLIDRCKLNTDEAAAQTVLGVDTDTGWLNGDDVAIASTSQTASAAETRTLNGAAGASSITVSVGLTNAHSGTSPTQAEVILLTRNVRVKSVSATFMAYVYLGNAAVLDLDWVEFRYLGAASSPKQGIEYAITTGSASFVFCSLREFDNNGLITADPAWNNLTIADMVGWKIGNQNANQAAIDLIVTTGTNWSIDRLCIISGNTNSGYGVRVANGKGHLRTLNINSCGGHAVYIDLLLTPIDGTWSDWVLHSNTQCGLKKISSYGGVISNVDCWRNNGGFAFAGIQIDDCWGVFIINGGRVFGNATANLSFANTSTRKVWTLRNLTIAGDTSFATTTGFQLSNNAVPNFVRFENCSFGFVTGIFTAHTQDIDCRGTDRYSEITLINTLLASATEIASTTRFKGRSFIAYQRADQVTNVHKKFYPSLGTVEYEATVFRTAAPSEKLTPTAATVGFKLESSSRFVAIASGGTVTVAAWVRKSAAYVGNAPRLMMRANPALGFDNDVVVDTHSAAADAWEQLTGTTGVAEEDGVVEFYIDCDGAAGIVYDDDWAAA